MTTTALDLRTRTAVHEAGRVVALHRLGYPPHAVSIVPIVGQGDDDVPAAGERHDVDTDSAGAQVLSVLAGSAAERAAGLPGAWANTETAEAVIDLWALPGRLTSWKAKATRLMGEPRNVNAVRALAVCLLAHDAIDARLVELIIRYADGECADLDLLAPLQSSGWLKLPRGKHSATQAEIAEMVRGAIWPPAP